MRRAASLTTATGWTTLLIKIAFDAAISAMHTSAAAEASSDSTNTRCCASRSDVTYRSTPTTRELKNSGYDTARIFSPVFGSLPLNDAILPPIALSTSLVPGSVPAVSP